MHTLFDLVLATPEIVLLVLTSLVLLLDAFDRESTRHMTFMLTMAALVIVIAKAGNSMRSRWPCSWCWAIRASSGATC
ncbi:hypothetical protein CDEF62S_00784 [Castellaniella defragrans]